MKSLQFSFYVLFALTSLCSAAQAQQPERKLPEEARKRLEHAIGEWTFVTRFYNREGQLVREIEGRDTNRYIIPGRVVEHTNRIPSRQSVSKGMMFYNFRDQKFYMTSVDKDGDLWILTGGLEKYVLTSRPRKRPDGTEMMIRFIHENIQPDSFEAQMEISRDGGKTWRRGSRQFLKRVKPQAAGTTDTASASLKQ